MAGATTSPFGRKRLFAVVFFAALFLAGSVAFYGTPLSVQRTYNLVAQTSDGVSIYFDVYEPRGGPAVKNAVILGHGIMVNKEVMKFLAMELAANGFVSVAFDFRSHGLSGGNFNFLAGKFDLKTFSMDNIAAFLSADTLVKDIDAVKSYLAGRGDINMTNLGYVGYSMGGGAGFAALANDIDFHAMVGVAPVPDFDRTNLTRPPNLLIVMGKNDEAISYNAVLKVMENKTGHAVTAADIDAQVAKNTTWEWAGGSFAAGTAARLVVDPLAEHFLAAWQPRFVQETRDWMCRALLGLAEAPNTQTYGTLVSVLLLQVTGGVAVFFLLAGFAVERYGRKKDQLVIPREFFEGKSLKSMVGGVFVYIAVLSFPCMLFIIPFYFAPLLITTFELMFIFGPSAATLLYVRHLTQKQLGIRQIYRNIFAATSRRNILLGLGLGVLFYAIMEVSVGQVFSFVPGIGKWPWVPLYFFLSLFCYGNFILYFQGVLQEKLPMRGWKDFAKVGLLNYGLTMLYAVFILLVPCLLLQNYFILMFFIPMVFLLLAAAFISTSFYAKTRDVLMPVISTVVLLTIMFCTLSPMINIWVFF